MTRDQQLHTKAKAAGEIGRLATRILELAPVAGLYVGIRVEPKGSAAPSASLRKWHSRAQASALDDLTVVIDRLEAVASESGEDGYAPQIARARKALAAFAEAPPKSGKRRS